MVRGFIDTYPDESAPARLQNAVPITGHLDIGPPLVLRRQCQFVSRIEGADVVMSAVIPGLKFPLLP